MYSFQFLSFLFSPEYTSKEKCFTLVENITYMCSKVTIENEGAAKSGCYSEYQDGRQIEVCVCKSTIGEIPCNAGENNFYFQLSFFYFVLFNVLLINIL